MKKRRDEQQEIEEQLRENIRRILQNEALPEGDRPRPLSGEETPRRDLEYESGPRLMPGMENRGIGSRIVEEETAPGEPDTEEDPGDLPEDGSVEDLPGSYRASLRYEEEAGGEAEGEDGQRSRAYHAKRERRERWPYLFISIAFGLIFLLLIGHLVYFNLVLKDEILNSPYNTRQNLQAEHVRRGSILSADGATLARTETDEDGHEERVYPYASVFAHVVGFASHGKSGIESVANYQLLSSHTNLIDQVINDFRNKKNEGDSVVTTLRADLQESAYYALGDFRGAVIAMNPRTGAIYAMVSKPDFDPNTISQVWDEMVSDSSNSQLVNRATQGLYPPGSTFKIITALAYYRKHHTFEGFTYDCTGEFRIEDSTVHCYKGAVHGVEDFTEAFAHSCNTAFSTIGLELGEAPLSAAAKSVLFGETMPIDLYSSRSRWSLSASDDDVMLVQTAFGQGKTLMTPFHLALIASAIANDGVLMKPYLIDHVISPTGEEVSRTKETVYRTLFTADEAEALTGIMEAVVEEGSASLLSEEGFRAAGKTGSAEYLKSDGSTGTHSWFVGFDQPGDPNLVIAVIAEDGGAGSSTAVPIAAEVLRSYYAA